MAVGSGSIRRLYVQIDADTGSAVRGLRTVDDAGDDTASSLARAEDSAGSLTTRLNGLKMATMALGGVALGAVGAMYGFARAAPSIGSELARVQATAGSTEQEIASLEDQVLSISRSLPVSAEQAAKAAESFSYAGFTTAETMAALGPAAEVAVAAGEDMASVSRTLSTAVRAFGLEAQATGQVTASLSQTFASSNSTISELSVALDRAAGTLSQANQSITETSAALGVMADRGLRSERAGSALRMLFERLSSQTGSTKEAMKRLNIQMSDLTTPDGRFKDLADVLSVIDGRLKGMSDTQRLKAITDLLGSEAAKGVLPLINNLDSLNQKIEQNVLANIRTAIDEFSELSEIELGQLSQQLGFEITSQTDTKEFVRGLKQQLASGVGEAELTEQLQTSLNLDVDTAEGIVSQAATQNVEQLTSAINNSVTAASIAEGQMDTLGGRTQQLENSFRSLAHGVFGAYKPALKELATSATSVLNSVAGIPGAASAIGVVLAGVATVAGAAAIGLGSLYTQVWLTNILQQEAVTTTYAYRGALWAQTVASRAAAGAQWLLTASLSDIITRLTTLIPTQYAASASSWTLSGAARAAAMGLKSMALSAYGALAALGPLGWAFIALGAGAAAFLTNAGGFRDWVMGILNSLPGVTDLIAGLTNILGWMVGGLVDVASAAGSMGLDALVAVLSPVATLFKTVGNAVADVVGWYNSLSGAGKFLLGVLFPILPILTGLQQGLHALAGAADGVSGKIEPLEEAWASLTGAVSGTIDRYFLRPLGQLKDELEAVERFLGFLLTGAEQTGSALRRYFEDLSLPDLATTATAAITLNPEAKTDDQARQRIGEKIANWADQHIVQPYRDDPIAASVATALSFMFGPIGLMFLPQTTELVGRVFDWAEENLLPAIMERPLLAALTIAFPPLGLSILGAEALAANEDVQRAFKGIQTALDEFIWQPFKSVMPRTAGVIEERVAQIAGAITWLGDTFADVKQDIQDWISSLTDAEGALGGMDFSIDLPDISLQQILNVLPVPVLIPLLLSKAWSQDDVRKMASNVVQGFVTALDIAVATFLAPDIMFRRFIDWANEGGRKTARRFIDGVKARLGEFTPELPRVKIPGLAFISQRFDSLRQDVQWLIDNLPSLPSVNLPDLPTLPGMGGQQPETVSPPAVEAPPPTAQPGRARESGRQMAEAFAAGQREGKNVIRQATAGLMSAADEYLPSSDARRGPLANLTSMGQSLPQTFASGIRSQTGAVSGAAATLAEEAAASLPDQLTPPAVGIGTTVDPLTRPELPSLPPVSIATQWDIPQPDLPTLPTLRPDISLPDLPALPTLRPDIALPDLPALPTLRPDISLPDLPALPTLRPDIALPDLPELTPEMSLPDVTAIRPPVDIPDLSTLSPDVSLPDLSDPTLQPSVTMPDLQPFTNVAETLSPTVTPDVDASTDFATPLQSAGETVATRLRTGAEEAATQLTTAFGSIGRLLPAQPFAPLSVPQPQLQAGGDVQPPPMETPDLAAGAPGGKQVTISVDASSSYDISGVADVSELRREMSQREQATESRLENRLHDALSPSGGYQ